MEKKLTKEERIKEKEKISNVITNKMAIVFVSLVIGIIAVVRFGEYAVPSPVALLCAQIALGVLFAVALVWSILGYKRGVDYRMKVVSAPLVLGIAASALFAVLFYPAFGAFRIILSLIAFAVLFFVYEIYAADFFLCSVAVFVCCIAASVINSAGFRGYNILANCVAVAIAVLVSAVCAGIVYKLDKDGKVKLLVKTVRKPFGMKPALIYAGISVSLLSVVATLIFGYLLYFIAAVCVVYFIIAIIYTVKLI